MQLAKTLKIQRQTVSFLVVAAFTSFTKSHSPAHDELRFGLLARASVQKFDARKRPVP
jgi:hypothetical protein